MHSTEDTITRTMPAATYRVTILNVRTGARREVTTFSLEAAELAASRATRGRTVASVRAL